MNGVKLFIATVLTFIAVEAFSQDSLFLRVHFLYGSKPKRLYKHKESKWFGGKLGGHVGIEADSNRIMNFLPQGKFHITNHKKEPHSSFAIHDRASFYSILGGNGGVAKKAVVYIPVKPEQKQKFDSITNAYLQKTPYDYALFGMRCGAAAYDILAQLDIMPSYSNTKTYMKIFYPKKLRKRLFKKARQQNWLILSEPGSQTRKWERD